MNEWTNEWLFYYFNSILMYVIVYALTTKFSILCSNAFYMMQGFFFGFFGFFCIQLNPTLIISMSPVSALAFESTVSNITKSNLRVVIWKRNLASKTETEATWRAELTCLLRVWGWLLPGGARLCCEIFRSGNQYCYMKYLIFKVKQNFCLHTI